MLYPSKPPPQPPVALEENLLCPLKGHLPSRTAITTEIIQQDVSALWILAHADTQGHGKPTWVPLK